MLTQELKIKWYRISLAFFLCTALIGTILRAMPYLSVSFNYQFLLHAHSHIAFQGWVYTLFLLLVPKLFLTTDQIKRGRYALQFKLTIPLLVLILVSFSTQGYSLLSIALSTLFQVLNYWFIIRFFRDSSDSANVNFSLSFVKAGFWFGLISTLAPYLVGLLSAKQMQATEIYESAIYFFLHFQYNGWFLFTIIGMTLRLLATLDISLNQVKLKRFLKLMVWSTILLYGHSLLGMSYAKWVLFPSLLGGCLQFLAMAILARGIKRISSKAKWTRILTYIALACLFFKALLQLISHLPLILNNVFENRLLIMAYMHLCLIGVISISLLAILLFLKWISPTPTTRIGLLLLIAGFILSELFLLGNGLGWTQPNLYIAVYSAIMALGIFLLLIGSTAKKINPT